MSERSYATGLAYRPDGRGSFSVYTLEKPGVVTAVLCAGADARLYAAAPDLLEALKWAESVVGAKWFGDPDSPKWLQLTKAAIAKAEGRP